MTTIKMYPAKNGDAFLVKNDSNSTAVLVDGGYTTTFDRFILPDLQKLANRGKELQLVIATHVDADHIGGLLRFFKANGHASKPKIIPVRHVWHNSLRSITTESQASPPLRDKESAVISEIRSIGFPNGSASTDTEEVSAQQGSSLAALLLGGGYRWNGDNGKLSVCQNSVERLGDSAEAISIGPPAEILARLTSWWASQLRQYGFFTENANGQFLDDAFEFLCAHQSLRDDVQPEEISGSDNLADSYTPDSSLTNASSISVVLTMGGKRLLFLGDSHPNDAEYAIRNQFNGEPVQFDAIKISHHGSLHNTSPSLLRLVDAPIYLISSNGEVHGHPDFAVLKEIADRPSTFRRELHFNYSTSASKRLREYSEKAPNPFLMHENSTDWISVERISQ
jgi:hypothetical protein